MEGGEPELWAENKPHYDAWWELSTERPVHMGGVGYIPRVAMLIHCFVADLELAPLIKDLRAMDEAYMKFLKEREEREQAQREAAQRRSDRPRGGRRG